MINYLLALASVLLVSVISLIGIIFIWVTEAKLKKLFTYLVSFAVGGLLGDTFLHLMPQMIETGFATETALVLIGGILVSFMVERFLQWRHCHVPTSKEHPHSFAYMNLFGDSIHNLIDGLIIGGSYLVSIPLGIATTIAIVFHEIPQELGDFSVLIYGGIHKKKALMFNFLTALTAVIGVVIALALGSLSQNATLWLVPFAAGNFIYIAGSDLIPELRKDEPEPKKSGLQLVSLVLGV
ncbi:MAG TPA: ZIP family metal transporter, partial [Candidatus Acidoferrales bacterium]|nr:ZIP family metal transporter [Candidatus Acidoferrales bacterium]